jgi:hypothetical protein
MLCSVAFVERVDLGHALNNKVQPAGSVDKEYLQVDDWQENLNILHCVFWKNVIKGKIGC